MPPGNACAVRAVLFVAEGYKGIDPPSPKCGYGATSPPGSQGDYLQQMKRRKGRTAFWRAFLLIEDKDIAEMEAGRHSSAACRWLSLAEMLLFASPIVPGGG